MNSQDAINCNKQRNMLLVAAKQAPGVISLPEYMLEIEGGKSDHPNDKGGLTYYGITLPFYHDMMRHYNPKLSSNTITEKFHKLTSVSAKGVYSMYFRKLLHETPALYAVPTDLLAHYLDVCVNSHERRATILLQRVLKLEDDGVFGPKTEAALKAAIANDEERKMLMIRYALARHNFYQMICKKDPSQLCFLKGWLNRFERVNKYIRIFNISCGMAGY